MIDSPPHAINGFVLKRGLGQGQGPTFALPARPVHLLRLLGTTGDRCHSDHSLTTTITAELGGPSLAPKALEPPGPRHRASLSHLRLAGDRGGKESGGDPPFPMIPSAHNLCCIPRDTDGYQSGSNRPALH